MTVRYAFIACCCIVAPYSSPVGIDLVVTEEHSGRNQIVKCMLLRKRRCFLRRRSCHIRIDEDEAAKAQGIAPEYQLQISRAV